VKSWWIFDMTNEKSVSAGWRKFAKVVRQLGGGILTNSLK